MRALFSHLKAVVTGRSAPADQAFDRRLEEIERRLGRLDKKLDAAGRQAADERLLLKRLEAGMARPGRRRRPPAGAAAAGPAPVRPSERRDWIELEACAACGHREASLVCEYNRFVALDAGRGPSDAVYNYSLCHHCGVVFAARRPTGARFRELLDGFSENLGRASRATLLLNPRPLDEASRADLARRLARGPFVSEHHGISKKAWLPGALRDRMSAAVHVELVGSLVPVHGARVLEIRTRTGAIGAALARLHGCRVDAMPMFETQQFVVQELYGIRADARIDFESFAIPYEGRYDLIVSNHMMTHAVAPAAFLRTVAEHLEDGGFFYLYNEPDEAEFLEHAQSMFNVLNPFHLQTFNGASLVRAVAQAGFTPVFVTHTDQNLVALFRKQTTEMPVMTPEERRRRLAAYQQARDYAIMALPDDRRGPFRAEWDQVVERAVVAGHATIDERGRLVFGRKLAAAPMVESH